jgi:hypothetical protein
MSEAKLMQVHGRIIKAFLAAAILSAAANAAPLFAQDSFPMPPETPAPAAAPGLTVTTDVHLKYTAGDYGLYAPGDYGAGFERSGLSGGFAAGADLVTGGTEIVGKLSADDDGKYGAALADIPGGNTYGFYFLLDEGGIRQKLGPLSLEVGRFRFQDEVNTPYSLFVNSTGISSTTAAFAVDTGIFYYKSRWIGLTYDSAVTSLGWGTQSWPDRGANIRSYGLRLGEMRMGFQDEAVYSGRYFDYEYFLDPLPAYFLQYLRGTGGVPWDTGYNDNCNMGLFWTWDRPGSFSLLAQVFLDDFNLHFIFPSWPNQPIRAAATIGGRLETKLGSFGLYAAMATKYTFEPSNGGSANDAYGCSYYPDTQYTSYWQDAGTDVTAPISIEDNEIGYKYGENNLALQVDWKGSLAGLNTGFALEFRLAGANAPTDPGQGLGYMPMTGVEWLNDAVLEKRIMGYVQASKDLGNWTLYAKAGAGVAFDALNLTSVAGAPDAYGTGSAIFIPVAGNTQYIGMLTIGATWHYHTAIK